MEIWQRCVGAALVGTDRQTPDLLQGEGSLAKVVGQMDWSQPERALLGAGGAIALHHKVGWRPKATNFSTVEPCEPEDLPCCRRQVEKHLCTALEKHPEVLPELLGLMAASGQRVPAQRLPALLNFGQRNKDLRPSIISVLGRRGQWLAAQNLQWQYATGALATVAPSGKTNSTEQYKGTTAQWLSQELQKSQRWDMAFSSTALNRFFEAAKDRINHIELSRLSVALSVALHPGLSPELAQRVKEFSVERSHSTLQTFLDRASGIVSLRWEIYQAFAASG